MESDNRLRVATRVGPDRIVLELHGELDLVGAPLLAEEIERAETDGRPSLVLDMQDLQFIDSAGLRVILSAHERAGERGEEFAVTPGPAQVQRLLAIAGVSEHLSVIDPADAAAVHGPGASETP
jgi:anti-sigma B factor antagonist